jgi:hypothetical protein
VKKSIKKLWIKALKSGKYEQATSQLRDGDAFCCLGVLCDLHSKSKKKSFWKEDESGVMSYFLGKNDGTESELLPYKVAKWAGIECSEDSSTAVLVPSEDENIELRGSSKTSLADLNDRGSTFKEIAAVIQKHL